MTSLWLNIMEMSVVNCSNFYLSLSLWKKGSLVPATYWFFAKKKQIVKVLNVNREVFLNETLHFVSLCQHNLVDLNIFYWSYMHFGGFFCHAKEMKQSFPHLHCSQSRNVAGNLKECIKIRKNTQFKWLDLVLIFRNVQKMQKFLFFVAQ